MIDPLFLKFYWSFIPFSEVHVANEIGVHDSNGRMFTIGTAGLIFYVLFVFVM
jgi:hypothetical protein